MLASLSIDFLLSMKSGIPLYLDYIKENKSDISKTTPKWYTPGPIKHSWVCPLHHDQGDLRDFQISDEKVLKYWLIPPFPPVALTSCLYRGEKCMVYVFDKNAAHAPAGERSCLVPRSEASICGPNAAACGIRFTFTLTGTMPVCQSPVEP